MFFGFLCFLAVFRRAFFGFLVWLGVCFLRPPPRGRRVALSGILLPLFCQIVSVLHFGAVVVCVPCGGVGIFAARNSGGAGVRGFCFLLLPSSWFSGLAPGLFCC